MRTLAKIFIIASLIIYGTDTQSQTVYTHYQNEIYNYLYRMAQKGIIRFDDNIRPVSRIYLGVCLDSLQQKSGMLSAVEKNELAFYRKDFTDQYLSETSNNHKPDFFRKDSAGRWRSFSAVSRNFSLRIDPVISAAIQTGTLKNITQTSSGMHLYGYAGNHWGFYFSFNDVNEKGTGLDTTRQFSPENGIVTRIASNKKSQNFSELRAGISYTWKNGSISFGQDNLLWGYGENGRLVLSAKAPTYPYIRIDYSPVSWLKFNYTHAWLNSNIIDSARSYSTGGSTYGGQRQLFVPKYMASHSIQLSPVKGLDLTLGESMVYSDRLEAGYLIPILFFKAYDNLINNGNINAGSNGQFFLQASSRNQLKNTHIYTTLFIDEVRLSTLFDRQKSRNQVGITVGVSVTDIFTPYLTMGIEYTRINPFVYNNLLPAQNYSNANFSLGDWMGNNADKFIYTLRYTPIPRLKCLVRYQSVRKGGAGTTDQQYFQQPQPPFLFDLQRKQKEWYARISYEWINNLYLFGYVSSLKTDDYVSGKSTTQNLLSMGLTFGL